MTKEEHLKRHQLLHKYLDELFADFIMQSKFRAGLKNTIYDLVQWSAKQIKDETIDHLEDENAKDRP